MRLKFFGQLSEITQKSEMEISFIADTDLLTQKVLTDFPSLKEHTFLIAVNQKIIKQNQQLEDGNEIAFLPPFAGG